MRQRHRGKNPMVGILLWLKENAIALIEPLVTLLGIIAGARMVAYQLARQDESSLALQRETAGRS
jgi:hypothetical protein